MAKHTSKILRYSHRKISKAILTMKNGIRLAFQYVTQFESWLASIFPL